MKILYKMFKNIVVGLHIYGARAISLILCDHQDTELD